MMIPFKILNGNIVKSTTLNRESKLLFIEPNIAKIESIGITSEYMGIRKK